VRPAQKRLDDLGRALDVARAALIEARAIENAGTRETAGALADAEQVGRGLAHELGTAAAVEAAIEAHVRETERTLDVLRRSLAAEVEKRVVLEETAAATGERITALRAKVEAQRAKVAPLVRRRAHEVDRLERRIALVAAHQAARAVIAPAKPRTVLGFLQAPETAP
jgi:hypothetical protein